MSRGPVFGEDLPERERFAAPPTTARQKWALTKQAFDELLARFDADVERAGEKYLLVRRNLVRYFEGRQCPLAEEHADETINRVAKRLGEGEAVRDLDHYFYGVARLLLLEILKEREKEERALREMGPLHLVRPETAEAEENEGRLACLTHCLAKLSVESRELITSYYQGEKGAKIDNRRRLAERLGIPLQALRSRAVRVREKLEECIAGCVRKQGAAGG